MGPSEEQPRTKALSVVWRWMARGCGVGVVTEGTMSWHPAGTDDSCNSSEAEGGTGTPAWSGGL